MSIPTSTPILLLLVASTWIGCAHLSSAAGSASESPDQETPSSESSEAKPSAEEPPARETAAVTRPSRPSRRPARAVAPRPAPRPEQESPAPKQAASGARAFRLGMTRPVRLSGPEPQYTPEAVAQRVQGLFIARCVVTLEGEVKDCRVIKPLPHMTEAVLAALHQQRYKPAMLDGEPIEVEYPFNIRLSLPRKQ